MSHRPGDKLMSRIPTHSEQVSSVLGTTMNALFGWGTLQDGWRKGPWTPQEDKLLIEHVNLHGEGRWNSVSKLTGLMRSGKSCRLRWVNYLRPDLKKGKITPHEEKIILELHARWGNRWSTIARSLPGRTDNEIKNYWRTHFKKGKSTKNVERARARFARQCQEQQQQQQQLLLQQEQEHPQQQEYQADMRGIMPQVEAAAIAHDMQEMAYYYMNPIPYAFQSNGGSTREEASSGDCAWESLWNLDDAQAQCGFMVQDQILSTY